MLKNSIAALIASITLINPFILESRTLHSFIAADTLSNLKVSTRVDIKSMKRLVRLISEHAQIPTANLILAHQYLTKTNLIKAIQEREVSSDDILLFYYTGHGFRTMDSKTVWPCIFFQKSKKNLDVDDLIKILLAKKASLNIVLADCCNNVTQLQYMDRSLIAKEKAPTSKQMDHTFKKLFSQKNMLIVATGAIPGKLSWATEEGGIFTNALIKSLEYESLQSDPKWSRVLKRTVAICKKYQHPQYSITKLYHTLN